jgi:hypothetical protein
MLRYNDREDALGIASGDDTLVELDLRCGGPAGIVGAYV